MKLSEASEKFIFKVRIELEDEGEFVVLREPTTLEMKDFSDDGKKNSELLMKLFPNCIVEHSFTQDDNSISSNKDVANFLLKSGTLYSKIITQWLEALPLAKKNEEKSDNSAE
jgi:hypothetical protein